MLDLGEEGVSVRVRIQDRALDRHEDLLLRELAAYLSARGFFVRRASRMLDVQPFNPTTERGDRERLESALRHWRREHRSAEVEILAS